MKKKADNNPDIYARSTALTILGISLIIIAFLLWAMYVISASYPEPAPIPSSWFALMGASFMLMGVFIVVINHIVR